MKIVMGLGNPGPRYDDTRHNVGWWAADRMAHDWDFGPFRQEGPGLVTGGVVAGQEVLLVKPTTYMNRSGMALRPHLGREGFSVSRDLMVVVDDATRPAGSVRLRPQGSAGGHNGLKSIEALLGHKEYPRLRIGSVGRPRARTWCPGCSRPWPPKTRTGFWRCWPTFRRPWSCGWKKEWSRP